MSCADVVGMVVGSVVGGGGGLGTGRGEDGCVQLGGTAPLTHSTLVLTPTIAMCLKERYVMRLKTPSGGMRSPYTQTSSTCVSTPFESTAVICTYSCTDPCKQIWFLETLL